MRHWFLEAVAGHLADRDVATLRFQFPFMEAGRKFPDRAPVLESVVRSAVARGIALASGAPIFAGGKSMGGRMTSQADAAESLGVAGIIFFGFPLHRPDRPTDLSRGDHLAEVSAPMLMVQGTRDSLARIGAITDLAGQTGAALHIVTAADHGFEVLVRSGRDPAEVIEEVAVAATGWMATVSINY